LINIYDNETVLSMNSAVNNFTQWLLSDEAPGFVTGTVIPVDGGFSAYSGV